MSRPPLVAEKPRNARDKILAAAVGLIRSQGYAGTTVDDLCRAAGVTKGAFFHYFASKEALGVAAADFWSRTTEALFASAPYHHHADPLDRVLGYLDFLAALIAGPVESFTCLAGTMVQEAFATNPTLREACEASIFGHAHTLEADIEGALEIYAVSGVTASSLAAHTQAVVQGAFILAKARGRPEAAADTITHLKRYVLLLFKPQGETDNAK